MGAVPRPRGPGKPRCSRHIYTTALSLSVAQGPLWESGWEAGKRQDTRKSAVKVSPNNTYINRNGAIAVPMGMLKWKEDISQNPTLERTTGRRISLSQE